MTMKAALLALSLLCSCGRQPAVTERHPREEAISGRAYLAIRAAEAELRKQGLHVSEYRVSVAEDGSIITVSFGDPNPPPYAAGSTGRAPGYWVRLSAKDLSVLTAHYTK